MPDTPEAWRDLLCKQLDGRRPMIGRYERYYEGYHRLAFATSKFREAFGNLFSAFADNWCQIVVDASVERLEVQGFRFGKDTGADDEAWRLWQANQLDADSGVAHEAAVTTGTAYLLVSPTDDPDTPMITVEHPAEMIVATAPGARRERQAALKRWRDEEGFAMATLYLPEGLFKWQSQAKDDEGKTVSWVERDGDATADNPLGVVPVVPLLNRPTMRGEGRSDLHSVIPEQDAVNKLVADMLVASEFAAYRQRWASGIEVPMDPDTGKPIRKIFDSAMDRLFTTANEDAKFGSFDASDLKNYVTGIEMMVQHIAAQTRTPPHYLLGHSGAFPSGESLKATETGLVAKVKRKMVNFGEAYEEAMRLAFKLKGDEKRSQAEDAETIWRDPESRTEGELVDALVKMGTLGVPNEALWERWGASPQQIARWKAMAAAEGLQAASNDFTRVFGLNGQGLGPDPAAGPGVPGGTPAPAPAGAPAV